MTDYHTIGISCRDCGENWKINIPLTGNKVEVFATICPCSAIIVGNYNSAIIKDELQGVRMVNDAISKDEKYLTNGHFDVLELDQETVEKLPELSLE